MLNRFHVLALTHQNLDLEVLGHFHLDDESIAEKLAQIKSLLNFDELMLLSTCNRFELFAVGDVDFSEQITRKILSTVKPNLLEEQINVATRGSNLYDGIDAVKHLFNVASSTESLVVGEREIITQVRVAYEKCFELGFTGDFLRLAIKNAIETAKRIYTETGISARPVSVVSLAFRKFKNQPLKGDEKVLFIGAGQTNTNMARFIKKLGLSHFHFFNRSIAGSEKLVAQFGGTANSLDELTTYKESFDVLVACTGASEPVVNSSLYQSLLNGDVSRKIIIDLGVPNDVDPEIHKNYSTTEINITTLKTIAEENMSLRKAELEKCQEIIDLAIEEFVARSKERQVELAMKEVPEAIKLIKNRAMNDVFNKELAELDDSSKEVLDKIISYMEKKYISVPMKMAKKIILEKPQYK